MPADLEHDAVRHSDAQVGRHRPKPVHAHALRRQVVRDLVDREEEILVGRSAYDVRGRKEFPRERVRVAEKEGASELGEDDGEDEVLGDG